VAAVAPGMSVQVAWVVVAAGRVCHWMLGAGVPLAALVKLAVSPSITAWLAGSLVMAGAMARWATVRLAAVLVVAGCGSIAMNVSARLLCGRTFWRYVLRIIIELQIIAAHTLSNELDVIQRLCDDH
jgi:hypothetical protein